MGEFRKIHISDTSTKQLILDNNTMRLVLEGEENLMYSKLSNNFASLQQWKFPP